MGGDGGTKAVNRKYLRGSKENANGDGKGKIDENERTLDRVTTCAISGKELSQPVVVCMVGYLYNKEEIYQRLLEKSIYEDEFKHIRKIKDLTTCDLAPNPAYKKGKTRTESGSKFICPITMQEMNGKYPFVILEKSGKILSLKAVKEVEGVTNGEGYLQLFPTAEEAKERQEAILSKRKSRKHKNKLKRGLEAGEPSERQQKTKMKKKSEMNNAFSLKAKQMIKAAEEKVAASKEGSETYKKLFAVEEEDQTKNGQDKNRLFMMGNPRASVRC